MVSIIRVWNCIFFVQLKCFLSYVIFPLLKKWEMGGVGPTKNEAERALRTAVICRETCFDSQSIGG